VRALHYRLEEEEEEEEEDAAQTYNH